MQRLMKTLGSLLLPSLSHQRTGLMFNMPPGLWFPHKFMSLNMWPYQLGTMGLATSIRLGTGFNSLWHQAPSYQMNDANSAAF